MKSSRIESDTVAANENELNETQSVRVKKIKINPVDSTAKVSPFRSLWLAIAASQIKNKKTKNQRRHQPWHVPTLWNTRGTLTDALGRRRRWP